MVYGLTSKDRTHYIIASSYKQVTVILNPGKVFILRKIQLNRFYSGGQLATEYPSVKLKAHRMIEIQN